MSTCSVNSKASEVDHSNIQKIASFILRQNPKNYFFQKSPGDTLLAWCGGSEEIKNASKVDLPETDFPHIYYRHFSLTGSGKYNPWKDFPKESNWIPDFFIHLKEDGNTRQLRGNFLLENITEKKNSIQSNDFKNAKRIEIPNKKEWNSYCEKISIALEDKVFDKIVPARIWHMEYTKALDQNSIFETLLEKFSKTELHFFCIREESSLFIGASPELLFKRKDKSLFVPAIAGTRLRGKTEIADKALATELFDSSKERLEHDFVVQYICEKLSGISSSPQKLSAEPEILKLPKLQHLYTSIQCTLNAEIESLELLKLLHPTPAMCGFPAIPAAKFLEEEELWHRGLYAAPLGYYYQSTDGSESKFIVGIRSALVKNDSIHFFAGAGFVKGSSAEAEWEETAQKMISFLDFF